MAASASSMLKQVSFVRVVYGVVTLFAPQLLERGDAGVPREARYTNALFGGRDLTIAGATIAALRAGREREAMLLNASCELTDSLSLVQELRRGRSMDETLGGALFFNVLGWTTVWRVARALRS